MIALIELMRPGNCLMAGIAAMVGVLIAGAVEDAGISAIIRVFLAVVLITGGGNAVNDYFDRRIDAINRPARPIPSGKVTPKQALSWSILLFFAGCLLAAVNTACLVVAAFNSILLVLYAMYLKSMPLVGNLAVSYLTASAIIFGGLVSGAVISIHAGFLAMLAGAATLARELVKDVEDIEGDRKCGAKTLPIVTGTMTANAIALLSLLFAVVCSYLVRMGTAYLVTVTAANLLLLLSASKILKDDPPAAQRMIKAGMGVALLAFVLGSVLN
jgi:geranylgeranylglycerol-phosphate geranylgeranyltransferase